MRFQRENLHRGHHDGHDARRRGHGFPGGDFGGPGWGFGGFGGFGPGGPGGPGGGPGGRGRGRGGRRPNVRAALLALLTERPMHGYEMIQELEQRTGGVWRPSPGSVYPTLQLLEDEGLIVSTTEGGRKSFVLTEAGQAEATQAAEQAPWSAFEAAGAVNSWHDIREAAMGTMNALRQVLRNGTDDQRTRAGEVLDEARRKLYAILAEEPQTR
jgi:DNA-binding PadR family transcriptional regulator